MIDMKVERENAICKNNIAKKINTLLNGKLASYVKNNTIDMEITEIPEKCKAIRIEVSFSSLHHFIVFRSKGINIEDAYKKIEKKLKKHLKEYI